LAAGPVGWGETVLGNAPFTAIQFLYADNFFKWMVFENPKWDFRTFDYDRDVALADKKLSAHIDAVNPDLRPFKSRGGNIIHYHGWSDPGVSPLNSINYYESVVATITHEQTTEFYRLFMVPGMAHCGGGPGPDEFDPLAAIQAWAENGDAPDRIVAVRRNRGAIERSRPLCPFPQVARWDGRGDVDRASSFGCVSPSPTR
jgi:feruloyl esterase